MPRKHHPVRYGESQHGYNRTYGRSSSSGETTGLYDTGSRYKGTNTNDNELATKWDDKNWTPFTLLEGATTAYRVVLAFLAAWQLCRHTEFWDSVWHGMFAALLAADGLIFLLTGYWVYVNYEARYNNATENGARPLRFNEDGTVIYSKPDELLKLPEIRQGWFYTSAVAGTTAVIYWCIEQFWDANKSRPLDCIDQRRLDRNMWLVLLSCVMWSAEPICYFFNGLVWMTRKVIGGKSKLMYDL